MTSEMIRGASYLLTCAVQIISDRKEYDALAKVVDKMEEQLDAETDLREKTVGEKK